MGQLSLFIALLFEAAQRALYSSTFLTKQEFAARIGLARMPDNTVRECHYDEKFVFIMEHVITSHKVSGAMRSINKYHVTGKVRIIQKLIQHLAKSVVQC